MPDKNILFLPGKRRSALLAFLLLSFATALNAQDAGNQHLTTRDTLPSAADGKGIHAFIKKGMYSNLVDSVNKRKLFPQGVAVNRSRFDTLFTSRIKETAFSGIKDTAMGEFLYYVKSNFGVDRVKKIVKNFSMAGDSGSLKNFISGKLRGFYSVNGKESFNIPSFDKLVTNQFSGVEYNIARDNTSLAPSPWMHQLSVNDQVQIMDIPFQVGFSNLSNEYVPLQYNNLMKVTFDKDGFQQGLSQKLGKYYNMKKYLLADMDMLSYVKNHFQSELSQQVQSISNDVITDPNALLRSKLSNDELLNLDNDQIQQKLMSSSEVQAMKERLQGSQQLLTEHGATMAAEQKDSLLQSMKSQSAYLASLEQMSGKISSLKNKMAASGINVNQVTRMQQKMDATAIENMQKPEVIKEAAGNLLPLNGLQKFFTNVGSLNAGTFGKEGSERGINTLLRGGLDLMMSKNKNAFGGGLGQVKDGGFLKDAGLQNSIFSSASFMQFLQFGKGEEGKNNTRFTVINSNTTSPNSANFSQLALPRNILAGTISKTIQVRKAGLVEAEISKSATQYKNTVAPDADQVMQHKSAVFSYTDDLLQTLSVGVRYTDEWEKLGLSHNAHISYAGFGYTNPGNPSAAKGSLQYDLQLRKQVTRNGFVQGRFANRSYNYSGDGGSRLNNMQVDLQGRYRFSRKLSLGAKLNQYQLVRKEADTKEKMYVSRKVSADAQYSGRIQGITQRTMFSLGWQQFNNIAVQQGGQSDLLLMQWVTSVPVGSKVISMNMFYNKEFADHELMGDLLTGEIGAGYPVLKSIMLNSSVTYLNNSIAARQIGIRQSVSTTVLKNCTLGLFIDCRKNLITPVNPYLYGSFRGELSVHYQFK
ncbi:hypothetical protein FAM09_17275 [Niastella caeni]|uniref:Uncharacterized protein n=1 Tax=Niastella caeni TaxID=2569763 RepID=A0A4S8HTQ6_9BACT|nr:hypothetical protein [Niastella caeni]THU38421.1 hypothetical protein FAM09_17275 [Niastella caeni]